MTFSESNDIKRLKREIIFLKRQIQQLQFQNSVTFKVLNIFNAFIFLAYAQFIFCYLLNTNSNLIPNSDIQFKTYLFQQEKVKLYTIVFKYHSNYFKVKVNKEFDNIILQSDALISKDIFFQIPQKIKFNIYPNQWFFINESLGIFTICAIIVFVQIIAFTYKLNEQFYPLISISTLNILSFIGILIFALDIHNFI